MAMINRLYAAVKAVRIELFFGIVLDSVFMSRHNQRCNRLSIPVLFP